MPLVSTSGSVSGPAGLSSSQAVLLRVSRTFFSMTSGLRRLTELVQGTTTLSQGPIWLLGTWYGVKDHDTSSSRLVPEVQEAFLRDFRSRIRCTYRRDFPPIGTSGLTSDIGWGCTLRSSQMLLAEALLRHTVGRQWQRGGASSQLPPEVLGLLECFLDIDSTKQLFSIHQICAAGHDFGVVPGKWLGPWVLCKSLEALLAQLNGNHASLSIHVVGDPGGGAPIVDGHRIHALLQLKLDSANASAEDRSATPSGVAEPAAVPGRNIDVGAVREPACAELEGLVQQQHEAQEEQHSAGTSGQRGAGLLLLVPLTLGIDKVSPLYHPQLQQVLSFPQSVGIVGGRPGASLYFVGYQDAQLLYLDPHEGQPSGPLSTTALSYFCDLPRLMPLTSLDPSLAIGFYCASQDDFSDLCGRLNELALAHKGAPLMTVATEQMHAAVYDYEAEYGVNGEDGTGDGVSSCACDSDGEGMKDVEAMGRNGQMRGLGDVAVAACGSVINVLSPPRERSRVLQQHEDWEML